MTSKRSHELWTSEWLLWCTAILGLLSSACSGNGEAGRSTEALCAELRRLEGIDRILGDLETSRLDEMREPLQKMVDVAPEDILPAVRDVSSVVGDVVERLKEVPDGDVDAAKHALAPIQERVTRAATSASRLREYAERECSLRL